jgi:ankyrin repeat protein
MWRWGFAFLLVPLAQASSGEDFSNNLLTDIAPLLALFGEQVAIDFMAGSLSWTEDIIFAMGALGVITAMVGAIRVGGPVWLKAIIGRARESRADIEMELLSSTSHDVCEAWNGQAIVRLVGTPSIVELIFSTELGDEASNDSRHEIRSVTEALEDGILQENPDTMAAATKHSDYTDDSIFEFPPNITLSVNGGGASRFELLVVAAIGIFVQSAVVFLAGFETYVPSWKIHFTNDDAPVGSYAFPLMAVGTALLVLGMVLSAHVITSSSQKGEWRIPPHFKSPVKLAWIQRGGRIGDQEFNSFSILSTGAIRLRKSIRRQQVRNGTLVVVATATTLLGFVAQFSALRFLHWSITIGQLVAIAIMTALRTWIRRHVASTPGGLEKLPQGYELDQFSKDLWNCRSWDVAPSQELSLDNSSSQPLAETKDHLGVTVFNARKRLQLISNWTTPYYETSQALCVAMESLMNMSIVSSSNALRTKGEFEWKIEVSVSQLDNTTDNALFMDTITVRLRRNFEHRRWSLWRVEVADIVALLGLCATDYHERHERTIDNTLMPNTDGQATKRSLRILGRLKDKHQEFKLWMPTDVEYYFPGDDPQRELRDLGIPESRTFPQPLSVTSDQTYYCVVIKATPYEVLAQMLFSSFLSQLAPYLQPFTDLVPRPAGGKAKFNSFGLHNRTVDKIVEELVHLGLATEAAAYASVVPVLFSRKLLPKLSNAKAVVTVLRDIKRMELTGLKDEADYIFLWMRHRLDMIAAVKSWDKSIAVYESFATACKRTFEKDHVWSVGVRNILKAFKFAYQDLLDRERLVDETTFFSTKQYFSQLLECMWKIEKGQSNVSLDTSNLVHFAVENGLLGIAQLLLSHDHTFLLQTNQIGETPLSIGLRSEEARMKRLLTFYDADDTGRDVSFLNAAEARNCELAEILLEAGANIAAKDTKGDTALHIAALKGDIDLVGLLLNFGMDPTTIKNNHHESALDIAVAKGHIKVVAKLLEHSRDRDPRDKHGRPQLLNAAALPGNVEVLQLLLERNTPVDATDEAGWTALHRSASNGDMEAVQAVVDSGADVNKPDANGWRPLHAACLPGHEEVVKMLLERGADATVSDGYGSTPLHGAASGGWTVVVTDLLAKGAIVNAKDRDGWTPLHHASFGGHTKVAEILLRNGADVETRDNANCAALQYAAAGGFVELKLLLQQKRADKAAISRMGES